MPQHYFNDGIIFFAEAPVMPVEHWSSTTISRCTSRGQVYNFAHLDPFQFEVSSTKVPRPIRINVRFTNHCFSEAFDPTKHPADEPVFPDGPRRPSVR